ncbi:MAG: DNA mismatch repair endonuclease MutL, partial [candidate division WOR-3 bacterium]
RLAICRHATSKLETIDDLRHLRSYGFRGEALASICAVSRLRIESNTEESIVGTFVSAEAGEIKELGDVGRSRGTTVSVTTLFYNLPVRRGFLKSDSVETRLVVETVKQYALIHPEIHFALRADGQELLLLPRGASIRERLALFVGREVAESLVECQVENPTLRISGYLASPFSPSDGYPLQQVFINRRPVRSRTVTRAVYETYGRSLQGGNPTFVLALETAPEKLDVNIHPTKQEVRFADERYLFDFVSEAVRQTLGLSASSVARGHEMTLEASALSADTQAQGFWQLHGAYIFAQVQSGYVVVDQHAAHERILYEELLRREGALPSEGQAPQGLLFPIAVELTAEEHVVFTKTRDLLATMGIQVRQFGGRTVVVETLPAGSSMSREEIRQLFAELAQFGQQRHGLREALARAIACKGAVKANQRLNQTEMESLINRLFACQNPFFCPHGRPAVIRVSLADLARRFGRS